MIFEKKERKKITFNFYTFFIIFINIILLTALIICLVLYNDQNTRENREQNINNLTNISISKSKLAQVILNNSTDSITSIYNYCKEKTLFDVMDYIYTYFSDENKNEFQLIRCTQKAIQETLYEGYSTIKENENYKKVKYTSSSHTELIYTYDECINSNIKGEIHYSVNFTNQTNGIKSYAPFCVISLKEGDVFYDYILLSPKSGKEMIANLMVTIQYDKLTTAVFDEEGYYLAFDAGYKSLNFYNHLATFNNISLEKINALKNSVQNNEEGTGILTYLDSRDRLCTYVYTRFYELNNWYAVVCVVNDDFISKSIMDAYPVIIMLILLITFMFDGIILLKINKKLRASAERERIANKAKTDFLSRMSHDIRTPMNGIVGLTDLTLEIKGLPNEARNNLKYIASANNYLINLINDILDMNMISSGKLELFNESGSVDEVISNIIQLSHLSIVDKSLSFVVEKNFEFEDKVMLDKVRLKQVLMNILSNAIKFTDTGGRITFSSVCNKKENNRLYYCFIIKDTGPGMSEDFIKKIFEPFSREFNSMTSKHVGTGLGMAIVKTIVDLMNGEIIIKSEKGIGTEITINLDFEIAKRTIETNEEETFQDYSVLEGKRFLIVDDHPINVTIACKMLETCGALVDSASNGEQALNLFKSSADGYYSAILMDVKMPVMDGVEATKEIRKLERKYAQVIPIIAMTANAFAEDVKSTRNAGMNAHLAKPINKEILLNTLIKYMDREKKNG